MGNPFKKEPNTLRADGFTLHVTSWYVLLDSESEGAEKYKRNYSKSDSFVQVGEKLLQDPEFNRACQDVGIAVSDTAPIGDGGLYRDRHKYFVHPYVYRNVILKESVLRKRFDRSMREAGYKGQLDLVENIQSQPIQQEKQSSAIVSQSNALSTPEQAKNIEQLKAVTAIFFQGADKIEDKEMKAALLNDFLRQNFLSK